MITGQSHKKTQIRTYIKGSPAMTRAYRLSLYPISSFPRRHRNWICIGFPARNFRCI